MNTQSLMDAAVKLAKLEAMPHDCGVLVPGENIKRVLVGVDMDTAELLLARELGFDCVVSHHPRNTSNEFVDVMDHHIQKLADCGVPYNKAYKIVNAVKKNRHISWHPGNSHRVESAAKLMNMPFMCLHTPADLITERFVQNFIDKRFNGNPRTTLNEITTALEEIHEFKKAVKKPVIRVGEGDCYAGKIYVSMSGLTNLDHTGLKAYFDAGIGTIIQMHITESDIKAAAEWKTGNIIITDHNASDSIGMNIIFAEWEKMGVEVTVMSGIVR